MVRVERFELIIKLILNQPPLPIGLHAREEIQVSKFQIRNLIWYRRRDSNPHCLVPKTSASSQLGYAGKRLPIFDCRFLVVLTKPGSEINWKLAIGNRQYFWWTWHDLNVRPRPSQSRALIPLSYRSGHFRLPVADLCAERWLFAQKGNRKLAMGWRRWSDSNAHRISPGTLAGCCHTS